ncbi:secreted RxLR effector protein 161-like [Cicer arietinum]|uniref:secreted RxLR effector protein 161-like n=1 Tax=Cicer arietinum TaxID=3827 RepID=UPI003CC52016
MVCTRPDIGHATGVFSRFMSNLGETQVQDYVDANFAIKVDQWRSTTGYIFTVGTTTVSWMSRIQKIVALSTTETEYVAVTEATKEIIWLQGLLTELSFI